MSEKNVLDRRAVYMEAFQERLSAQLDVWGVHIDQLLAKAAQAKAGARMMYLGMVDELGRKRRALQTRLLELRTTREEVWDLRKRMTEDSVKELEKGIEQAWQTLRD